MMISSSFNDNPPIKTTHNTHSSNILWHYGVAQQICDEQYQVFTVVVFGIPLPLYRRGEYPLAPLIIVCTVFHQVSYCQSYSEVRSIEDYFFLCVKCGDDIRTLVKCNKFEIVHSLVVFIYLQPTINPYLLLYKCSLEVCFVGTSRCATNFTNSQFPKLNENPNTQHTILCQRNGTNAYPITLQCILKQQCNILWCNMVRLLYLFLNVGGYFIKKHYVTRAGE